MKQRQKEIMVEVMTKKKKSGGGIPDSCWGKERRENSIVKKRGGIPKKGGRECAGGGKIKAFGVKWPRKGRMGVGRKAGCKRGLYGASRTDEIDGGRALE